MSQFTLLERHVFTDSDGIMRLLESGTVVGDGTRISVSDRAVSPSMIGNDVASDAKVDVVISRVFAPVVPGVMPTVIKQQVPGFNAKRQVKVSTR